MQSEAYKLSGFTVVISALGFLFRWLQDMRIANKETGLAVNAPISWLMAGVIVLAAAGLALYVMHLRQFDVPVTAAEAYRGHTPFYGAILLIPSVVLALSGLLQVLKPGDSTLWPAMHRMCGGAMMLGAFGSAVMSVNIAREGRERMCRVGFWFMMVFAVFWLVTGYRDAAGDPVVWRFAVSILAQCAILLALYRAAGFFFNSPDARRAIFMCNLAAFMCIISAIDGSTLGGEDIDLGSLAQSGAFIAMAMQFLIWAFVITENLKTKPLTPVGRKEK